MDGQMDGRTDGWTDRRMDGRMDGRTDGWTDGRMENLPILQDFVPYQGCCPATFCDFTTSKKQGKATADHMMPLGAWFFLDSVQNSIFLVVRHNSIRGYVCPSVGWLVGLSVRPSVRLLVGLYKTQIFGGR